MGSANLSTLAESEKSKIYPQHYEATQAEVDAMTPDQYAVWSKLGGHLKKTPEQVALDAEQEERARARAEENELTAKMTMPEYVAYREQKAAEAQREKEEATKLVQGEQQDKLNALRRKAPAEMSMEEYATWSKIR